MGFLWDIPLVRITEEIDYIVCYGVRKILDHVGRDSSPQGPEAFPHLPPEIFKEIKHQDLDVLVGNADIKIQPSCAKGFGKCQDCK